MKFLRGPLAPALGAAAAVTAMIYASRLPPTLDFILPHRAAFWIFHCGFETLSKPWSRRFFVGLVVLILIVSLSRYLLLLFRSIRGQSWSPKQFLIRGLKAAVVVVLFRWSWSMWLEVSQRALYPFGSMDPFEPFMNLAVFSVLFGVGMSALLDAVAVRPTKRSGVIAAWTIVNVMAALLSFGFFNAWTGPVGRSLEARRFIVVLTEEGGRPAQAAYDVPVEGSASWLSAIEKLAASPAVQRLEALRLLYEERAKAMDAEGLRRALLLGVRRGDDLARSLLLEHAYSAPPSDETARALAALSDETRHRVGPLGAARLARAYARLGDARRAGQWAEKASAGQRGIPRGLIELPAGGALKPGRISGRVTGEKPETVALYLKKDPAAPYLLDAGSFAASVAPGADGRFAFSGLAAGRYYLAFAYRAGEKPRGEVRVLGHRGDVSLDARKTASDLPPLTLKSIP